MSVLTCNWMLYMYALSVHIQGKLWTRSRSSQSDPCSKDPPLHNPSLVIFTLIALVLHAKPT